MTLIRIDKSKVEKEEVDYLSDNLNFSIKKPRFINKVPRNAKTKYKRDMELIEAKDNW